MTLFKFLPAIGGPVVSDIPHIPRINPIPCDAPEGPHIPYAIGPNIVMKQPSNKPSIRERMTIDGYVATDRNGDAVKSIVHIPMEIKDICCRKIGLTLE